MFKIVQSRQSSFVAAPFNSTKHSHENFDALSSFATLKNFCAIGNDQESQMALGAGYETGYFGRLRPGVQHRRCAVRVRHRSERNDSPIHKCSVCEMGKSLNGFGAAFHHVVKENPYTTGREAVKKCNDSRKIFYKGDEPGCHLGSGGTLV